MEPVKLTYQVDDGNYLAAGSASTNVKRVLKKLGIPSDIIRRAVVCLYEGEINMVIHANGGQIDVEIDPAAITMILKDVGPGIADISKAMQDGYSTASKEARDLGFGAGMGLPNMKRNSDEMNIDTVIGQGTTVTMTLHLQEAAQ